MRSTGVQTGVQTGVVPTDDQPAVRSDQPGPHARDGVAGDAANSILPQRSQDEDGPGWGDASTDAENADRAAWLERERPPHHE